jgi:hypothetical protein
LTIVEQMRAALEGAVARARAQRLLIRKLDSAGLLRDAELRAAFNTRLAELEAALAVELKAGAAGAALSLQSLRALPGPEGRGIADGLAEVRALAGALAELDGLNRLLAERALACVRGYLDAVAPRTSAYDRRGALTGATAVTTASRIA